MPNQNECDHVGLIDLDGGDVFSIGELFYRINNGEIDKEDFYENYVDYIHDNYERFNYCPDCGARIDWEKIEEMVKDAE